MTDKPKRPPLGERLKNSLLEGIEYARGERPDLRTTDVPAARTYSSQDILRIRKRRGLTQTQFALLLDVSPKSVQSWEQGIRTPNRATMRLLQIFDQPTDFLRLLQANALDDKSIRGVSESKTPYGQKDEDGSSTQEG